MQIHPIAEKSNLPLSIASSGTSGTNISKKISALINSKNPDEDAALFKAIFDNEIPIHPLMKLYIAERLHIQPSCSRGFIHSMLVETVFKTNDPQGIKNICKISVENPGGPGDINFALELSRNSEHLNFLVKNMPATFQIKSLTLLHKNIPGSFDAQQSLLRTGQVNCDSRLDVINNNVSQKIYLDTKQTGASKLDMKHNYLKIIYNIPYSDYNEADMTMQYLINNTLIFEHYKNLASIPSELESLKYILEVLNSSQNDPCKINEIHKFVLANYDKPYGKIAVILQQEVIVSEYHEVNLSLIEMRDCNDFTSGAFSIQQKMIFQEVSNKFAITSSAEKLQARISNENIDHLQKWFKPKYLENNFEDIA